MKNIEDILQLIKASIRNTDPDATLILYGSYARGDYNESSDLDLLVLVNKDNISRTDHKRIKYPLYDIEFENGVIISPMVLSKKDWKIKHHKTPFFETISEEGQVL